jgi:hypothetical protein
MSHDPQDIVSSAAKFAEALAVLNAAANQQAMQILQLASLGVQVKSLGETDMTQAIIESKMASQLTQQERMRRVLSATSQETK